MKAILKVLGVLAPVITILVGVKTLVFPGQDSSITTYAPQNMEGSPNGIQVQGNNNNVNQEATYTWTNKNTWVAVPVSEVSPKSGNQETRVDLYFVADGPLAPARSCFNISSDALILSADAHVGVMNMQSSNLPSKIYTRCQNELETPVTFSIIFETEPAQISAELVKG